MKKILVCLFLLVFGLCLAGCEQLHTGPKEDIVIDGEYYAKVIYDSPFLSSRAYSRKIIIDNNKLDDLEFIDYELQGDFFTSIPNTDKDVFSSIMNIEKIWFAEVLQPEDIEGEFGYYLTLVNSNYYLYYGRYTEDNGYSINHAFKLIRLDTEKEILCDFLTLLNPLLVTLINGNDNSMIDKSYYDFESQLFFEEFMQIEVSKLDNFEKYDMLDVDYYISFSTFTEDFVSLQFYNVKNSDYEQYYGRIYGNLLDGIYQFSINEDLFNKVFDYFTNNTRFEESLYKLTIQNDSSNELIGIKNEYKAGEEVEVKMEYDMAVEAYVFLNGELLGTLNGSNSLKFNMPEKDSTLVVTYTNAEIYKVNVIDNFDLLIVPLKEYYNAGDTVQVITKFLSGPRVDVQVDGQFLEIKELEAFGYYGYEFIMPEKDVEIVILYNGLMNKPCEDNTHKWDEGIEIDTGTGTPVVEYTCRLCGNKYRVTLKIPVQPSECPYVWKTTEESHTLIMLCDCHRTSAVEEPHKDLDKNHYCDECGYVFHTTGINGIYTPELLANLNHNINKIDSLIIEEEILYVILQNNESEKIGKFELISESSIKLNQIINIDDLSFANEESKNIVNQLLDKDSFYSMEIASIPEIAPTYILVELNNEFYYIYMESNIAGVSVVTIYHLNK